MATHKKRVDANQALIVTALREKGHTVKVRSAQGDGIPDLQVMTRKHRRPFWLECKMPGECLTAAEREFFAWWPGLCEIARTPEQAVEIAEERDWEE